MPPPAPNVAVGVELVHRKDDVVLKRVHLILAAALVAILLALAFGLGVMVGKMI